MKQSKRTQHLITLLQTRSFSSHEDLLAALEKRGVPSTQATLSRDLNRLSCQKVHGVYQLSKPTSQVQIQAAGPNLLVVKTRPGHASAVAAQIDANTLEGLVGTIAGDDSIFIATHDAKAQNQIHRALLEIFGEVV
ncbi:MAG: hypothetical protein JKY15_02655 [Deltaproteobacteria bacterium]|nr:hypothetical protein [Deltaproteobacteria bacterium]